jgi:acyl-CoA synthetase (AMP-forming)/AMP-acid ligase II
MSSDMETDIETKISEDKKNTEITIVKTTDTNTVNVAGYLKTIADEQPQKRAVVFPFGRDDQGRVAYTHLTFQQLHRDSDSLAHGLSKFGITRNTRTILMVPPSLDFFVLIFAFFKAGIIPVVVDPGMGVKRMLVCMKESRAEAIVAVSKVHLLRFLHPGSFKTVRYMVTVGKRWFWRGVNLSDLFMRPWKPFPIVKTKGKDMAAILFTTGSTGPAKGVVYTHGVFDAQVRTIRSTFRFGSHEIDLPTFPLFSLFDPVLAMTAVIPDMDPTQPAKVDPKKIFEAFQNQDVNNMFASPALLDRVGHFANRLNLKVPGLKKVISAGAPLAPGIIKNFVKLLPKDGEIITGYGATEAMPVTTIGSNEILSKTLPLTQKGFGICIGQPVEGIKVRIIDISDVPISTWSEVKVMQEGEIGEIVVQGECVTHHYFERPHDDALAKIKDGDKFWHRMGDLGWRDQHGRLWFCGRKSHRVQGDGKTYFTIPCEAIFNAHSRVFRSALVGVGSAPQQKPVICIELNANDNGQNKTTLTKELLKLAKTNILTEDIDTILYHREFPVDIRHNAKIFREKLASWAAEKVKI